MKPKKVSSETLTLGQKLADRVSNFIGSWIFIGIQSSFLIFWIIVNLTLPKKPDPYPFILLNLMLSFSAAYSAPLILMSANRQSEMDRKRAIENLELDHTDHIHLIKLAKHIDEHFDNLHVKIDNIEDNTKKENKPNKFIF